jgi:redox-sensing transcriptional repressor
MKLDRVWNMAVVGAGDVGHALARYQGFRDRGFQVSMIFDKDPAKVGKKIDEFIILDTDNMVTAIRNAGIKIAMVATPAAYAQEVVDKLVEAGVQAILNYAPIQIITPTEVRVQYIDPATHLQRMSYYLD